MRQASKGAHDSRGSLLATRLLAAKYSTSLPPKVPFPSPPPQGAFLLARKKTTQSPWPELRRPNSVHTFLLHDDLPQDSPEPKASDFFFFFTSGEVRFLGWGDLDSPNLTHKAWLVRLPKRKTRAKKWKHGPRPAVCPSDPLILSHTHI